MTEIERIRAMAAEGAITEDEADKLISLLQDIDRTEGQVDELAAAASEVRSTSVRSDPARSDRAQSDPAQSDAAQSGAPEPDAQTPPDMSRARAETTSAETDVQGVHTHVHAERPHVHVERPPRPAASKATWNTPPGFRWLKISMLAGDIDVTVDPSLSAPDVDGPEGVSLEEAAFGYELKLDKGGSLFERLLRGGMDRDIDVRLPENMGIDLQMKAGDVELKGVPYLKGDLLAGDLDARGLKGVDLQMKAGDVDLWLAPTEGEHRLSVTAGDVHVRLDAASDVSVEGRVNIGDARVPPGFESKRQGIGESFSGTVGNGTARLRIAQSTGDVKVSVSHE